MSKIAIYISFICISLFFNSCGNTVFYTDAKNITNEIWTWDNTLKYEFELGEEQLKNKLFIDLKHSTNYAFRNIYFFSHLELPNGNVIEDTLQYYIAEKDGKWIGNSIGNTKDISLHYPILLNQKGKYKFSLSQAMRIDSLIGIKKVALTIEDNEL